MYCKKIQRLMVGVLTVLLSIQLQTVLAAPGDTTLITRGINGEPANGGSDSAEISDDGRIVVFSSEASNLVSDDTNLGNGQFVTGRDVFVYDKQADKIELVSVSSSGEQANFSTNAGDLSADGRFVVFSSEADNLVPGDTNIDQWGNPVSDIFVRDRQTGKTERASVSSTGEQANGDSVGGQISADGRFIVFSSSASNLVPGDSNANSDGNPAYDIFVHDRQTGVTERISVSDAGEQGNNHSYSHDISADGRFIVFESLASNLVPGDTNGGAHFGQDIFIRDRQTSETSRVSVNNMGEQANAESFSPSISADGQFVAFVSQASNLAPGDDEFSEDVFVFNRETGHLEFIPDSSSSVISADGRFVLHDRDVSHGPISVRNVFIHDRQLGYAEPVDVNSSGDLANGESFSGGISADGRFAVFSSKGDNLTSGDSNDVNDIFIHERSVKDIAALPQSYTALQGNPLPLILQGVPDTEVLIYTVTDAPDHGALSGVAPMLTYTSNANYTGRDRFTFTVSNGVETSESTPVNIEIVGEGVTSLISRGYNGKPANSISEDSAISADGRFVVFSSSASNLAPGDANGNGGIFVVDRHTGKTERVSISSSGEPANNYSQNASISADGRFVVFETSATNLSPGDAENSGDIFVHDRQTGKTELVNVNSRGERANGSYSAESIISADGRHVVFASDASNLVPDDTNGDLNFGTGGDIFVRDLQAATTERVNVSSTGEQANGNSSYPAVSADGRFVVYRSNASNLVSGDTNGAGDVFVHDRQTGKTGRVNINSSGNQSQGDDNNNVYIDSTPGISADGRYVVFESSASDLSPEDANPGGGNYPQGTDIFVHDRQTGRTDLVSVSSDGKPANHDSSSPGISADGRFVVFLSEADNLVPGDTNNSLDIFIHDQLTGETTRANVSTAGAQSDRVYASAPGISADGRVITFASDADNLTSEFVSGAPNIYVREHKIENVVAQPQLLTTPQGKPVPVTLKGMSANASTLSYQLVSQPEHGALSGSLPELTYTPEAGYTGFDSLIFTATDGDETSPPVTVLIEIFPHGVTTAVARTHDTGRQIGKSNLSANGRYLVFASNASDLVQGMIENYASDVFVFDRETGKMELVSINSTGEQGNGDSGGLYSDGSPGISADGRYVVFESTASNLAPEDANHGGNTHSGSDIFVHDRQTGYTRLVSVSSIGDSANSDSKNPSISADGRYVAFDSLASTLVSEDTNDAQDVFMHDLQTGETERISVGSNGEQGNEYASGGRISANGRYVAFVSYASNLAPGDNGGVFVRDRQTGVTDLVDVEGSSMGDISAAGRYVVYSASSANTDYITHVFIHDRQTDETKLISASGTGEPANNESSNPRISADGRYIVFDSTASNLLPGYVDSPFGIFDASHIFIHDRHTDKTELVDISNTGAPTEGGSRNPGINADGRVVVFGSDGSFLVQGDTQQTSGIYVRERDVENNTLIALPQSLTVLLDSPIPVMLQGLPTIEKLTYTVTENPNHGVLTGIAPDLSYIPDAGYTGQDSFAFTVTDGVLTSAPATVNLSVQQATAKLALKVLLNGEETIQPGPSLPNTGSAIAWTYTVHNIGSGVAEGMRVYGKPIKPTASDWQVLCRLGTIPVGESRRCEVSDTVVKGIYKALISVQGFNPDGTKITLGQTAFYTGGFDSSYPSLSLKVQTNGQDNDNVFPGPELVTGQSVTYSYDVTNTGPVLLHKVRVFDRQESPGMSPWQKVCIIDSLAIGESVSCTLEDTVAAGEINRNAAALSYYKGNRVSNGDYHFYQGR